MAETIRCPLCCEKTFHSKLSLLEHLSQYEEAIKCSICNTLFTSLPILLKHLKEEMCSSLNAQMINNRTNSPSEQQIDASDQDCKMVANPIEDNNTSPTELISEFDEDTNQIYSELLKRPLMQDLEDHKLTLLNENGQQGNDYVLVSQNGIHNLNGDSIVTKQNSDGTISITDDNDIKQEVTQVTFEPEVDLKEMNDMEMYSCNTCGVTFTSIIDHIETFHKNQDIILENTNQTAMEELSKEDTEKTDETTIKTESTNAATNRFITVDEGYIMENDSNASLNNSTTENGIETTKSKPEEVVLDKKGRKFTRRYVPVGKDVKQKSLLKQNQNKASKPKALQAKKTYHQVIVKNMMTLDGSSTVQVFFCLSCNTYVSELKDFRNHPCNDLAKNGSTHAPILENGSKNSEDLTLLKKEPVDINMPAVIALLPRTAKTRAPLPELEGPDFRCDICSTVFLTNKSLKLHKRMHDPLKIKPIEAPVAIQVDGSTVVDSTYLCTVCYKMIPSSYKHIHTMSHEAQETFHCDICNKKFSSNDYLTMHMKAHNVTKGNQKSSNKVLPYSCIYCPRQFARPHEKVKHERIHTGEKPHSCEICGKTFRVAYCLTLHMRTHTGARPYACPHCGKRFKAHSVYNHHLLTHSDVRAYQCPFCPKAFKNSVQLAGHKNSHTKPFSCKDCNRPFASLYAVRCHTETHKRLSNNLKYNCTLCGASYARAFALNDHMKQVHPGHELLQPATEPEHKDFVVENVFEIAQAECEEVLA